LVLYVNSPSIAMGFLLSGVAIQPSCFSQEAA
jgi:hypothetical protein